MAIKNQDAHAFIKAAWDAGKVRLSTLHGTQRSVERDITMTDIRDVIIYGDREGKQDTDKGTHWVYAIRNKNVDGRDIRIIFDIEGYPDVVIITVMHVYP